METSHENKNETAQVIEPSLPVESTSNGESVAAYAESSDIVSKPEYRRAREEVNNLCETFLRTIWIISQASSRFHAQHIQSVLFTCEHQILQSALAIQLLAREGIFMPVVKRELRYMLEATTRYLYVDQKCAIDEKYTTLEQRLTFLSDLDRKSIEGTDKNFPIDQVNLTTVFFDAAQLSKQIIDRCKDVYRYTCHFIHANVKLIRERLLLDIQERYIGYEGADEMDNLYLHLFVVFELVIVLFLASPSLGPSSIGDLVMAFADMPADEFVFHKSSFWSSIDAQYDYKYERQDNLPAIRKHRLEKQKTEPVLNTLFRFPTADDLKKMRRIQKSQAEAAARRTKKQAAAKPKLRGMDSE